MAVHQAKLLFRPARPVELSRSFRSVQQCHSVPSVSHRFVPLSQLFLLVRAISLARAWISLILTARLSALHFVYCRPKWATAGAHYHLGYNLKRHSLRYRRLFAWIHAGVLWAAQSCTAKWFACWWLASNPRNHAKSPLCQKQGAQLSSGPTMSGSAYASRQQWLCTRVTSRSF